MTGALYVAAGGGGDAIAAAILANRENPGETANIATYAWDRLIIDPLPGPRSAADFDNLTEHAPNVWQITPETTPKPPAGSTLPRLSGELNARLFLLDPHGGAIGMAEQLNSITRFVGVPRLVLVDVGGDLIARGTESDLRSPIADALALAACALTLLPCDIVVAGPGVDGELPESQVIELSNGLGCVALHPLAADEAKPFTKLFEWHPSEATGLWTAAALGHRGKVEIRDAGLPVMLTDATPSVQSTVIGKALSTNVFFEALKNSRSLKEVEHVVRNVRGGSEIDYERRKSNRRKNKFEYKSTAEISVKIAEISRDASLRADYITIRRLSELADYPYQRISKLLELLRALDAVRLTPPLWRLNSSRSPIPHTRG
ncbi:DUF1152 domain-containing protein [Actinocrispum sp. NPDC049592]|uniref:DUF1152 domain-containing protein n=1 Tax=Actinocrispum sp. NPDC049592 TaxID=3154835 RepID=UPI003423C126